MKYINKLTNKQIKEILFDIYNIDGNILYKNFDKKNGCLEIEIDNMYNDRFELEDYCIFACDFSVNNIYKDNIEYYKKMLEYFGEQYAIDYLLGE